MSCRKPGNYGVISLAAALTPGCDVDTAGAAFHRARTDAADDHPADATVHPDEAIAYLRRQVGLAYTALPESRRRSTIVASLEARIADVYDGRDVDAVTFDAWQRIPAHLASTAAGSGTSSTSDPAPPPPAAAASEEDPVPPARPARRGPGATRPGTAPAASTGRSVRPAGLREGRPYQDRINRFKRGVLPATDRLYQSRPSRLPLPQQQEVFRAWINDVSAAYDLTPPRFVLDPDTFAPGGGMYDSRTDTITMSRPSVTTLLHEYRHFLQFHDGSQVTHRTYSSDDLEHDARAWSLSLIKRVRPRLFHRLARAGQIGYVDPHTLAATTHMADPAG